MDRKNPYTKNDDPLVYVGAYTHGGGEGITSIRLDLTTGQLHRVAVIRGVDNPSYLAVDADRDRLYAVNELSEFEGRPGGAISAFAIDPASGALSLLSQQRSHGGAPCYLTVDRSGRYLLAVNYMGGNVVVIPTGEDGVLGEATTIVTHSGSGPHPKRQEGPHPHSIVLDPAGRFAFAPDLGLDRVMQYRFDGDGGLLYANRPPWLEVRAGSGPRHLVFHPNRTKAYVINELDSTITALAYDASRGTLAAIQTVSTLPAGFAGKNIAADLHLTPDGRFLYGSNRGHDSIACYAVDSESGRLTFLDTVGTGGETPRGFAIDPSGSYVLVANQDSHTVVTFRIDEDLGKLTATGHAAHIPSPVCVKFWH